MPYTSTVHLSTVVMEEEGHTLFSWSRRGVFLYHSQPRSPHLFRYLSVFFLFFYYLMNPWISRGQRWWNNDLREVGEGWRRWVKEHVAMAAEAAVVGGRAGRDEVSMLNWWSSNKCGESGHYGTEFSFATSNKRCACVALSAPCCWKIKSYNIISSSPDGTIMSLNLTCSRRGKLLFRPPLLKTLYFS